MSIATTKTEVKGPSPEDAHHTVVCCDDDSGDEGDTARFVR